MIIAILAYTPFLYPLPVWSNRVWPWLLLPLCIAVAVVYKCTKCRSMRRVPIESATLAFWIVLGMSGAAVALTVLVKVMER